MRLTRINNGLGIKIPKSLIEQSGLMNQELELRVTGQGLLIAPAGKIRQGWAEAAREQHQTGADHTPLQDGNRFDEEQWLW